MPYGTVESPMALHSAKTWVEYRRGILISERTCIVTEVLHIVKQATAILVKHVVDMHKREMCC